MAPGSHLSKNFLKSRQIYRIQVTSPFDRLCNRVLFTPATKREPPGNPNVTAGVSPQSNVTWKCHTLINVIFADRSLLSCLLFSFVSLAPASVTLLASAGLHHLQSPPRSLDHCSGFSTCSLALARRIPSGSAKQKQVYGRKKMKERWNRLCFTLCVLESTKSKRVEQTK